MKNKKIASRLVFVAVLAVGLIGLRPLWARADNDGTPGTSTISDADESVETGLSQVQQLRFQLDQEEAVLSAEGAPATVSNSSKSAAASVNSMTSPSPTPITSCQDITQPGSYVLMNNLTGAPDSSSACINIVNTQNVQLNCNNFSISQNASVQGANIDVVGTTNYTIQNCNLLAPSSTGSAFISADNSPYGTIENNTVPVYAPSGLIALSSDNMTVTNNAFDSTLQVQGNNETITNNTIDFTGANALDADNIFLFASANSVISGNTLNGGWNGVAGSEIGADDNINTSDVTNSTISNNTMSNVWDTGIEPVSIFNNNTVSNNHITNALFSGIGEWYGLSMQGNIISGNTVNESQRLFNFVRMLPLQPTEQAVYFLNNTFSNNSLTNSVSGGTNTVDVMTGAGGNTIPANQFVTGNNVFTGNEFGDGWEPDFAPYAMFIDGGGNQCGNIGESLEPPSPLDCSGNAVPPIAPKLISATAVGGTLVNLAWSESSSPASPSAAGYQILRNGGIIASVPSTVFSYADTTTASGTSYTYTVKAFSGANIYSVPSNGIAVTTAGSIPPALPVISSFTALPESIASGQFSTLSWSATGTTSLSIDNGVGIVTGTSVSVYPTVSTTYTLTATNSSGSATSSTTVTVSAPVNNSPATPTLTSATVINGNQVNLAWTQSTDTIGVIGYQLTRNGSFLIALSSPTLSYSDMTVAPNTTYTYSVKAFDAASNYSAASNAITVVTPNPVVSLPAISSFSASPATVTSGQSATLSWSVTGAASISITGIGTVTGSSVSVSPSVTTTYTLTATNSAGSATATATVTVNSPVDTTPPSAPSLTSATASGPTQVGLSWAASTDNVGVAGYQITRNGSVIGSVGSSVLSYADANVAAGTSYTYSVKAYDAAGNYSAASNALTVVTPNPVVSLPAISSFSASPATVAAGQSATLSWSVSGATVVSVSGIGTVTGSSASVSPAQTTTYTLTATNSGGSVTAMATVTVTAQAAPAIAMVTPVPGQVVSGYVTLTAATNFVPNPQTLAASFDGGGRGKTFTLSPSGSAYAASVSTYVLPDGAHTLTVTGYDAQGILHSVSESFTVDNNGTPVSLPAISSFSASPSAVTSGQSATLSWSVTGAASISITGIGTVTGSSVSVSPSVTTTYTLTATNSAGSATATATVTVNSPVDTTPPSAPSLTSATASGPTQVGLSWAASTDNVGVAGYQITRNGSVIGSVGSSVLSYADANVAAGTSYTYSVKAYDAAGNYSAASNALTVVTPQNIAETITILSPSQNQTMVGSITISASANFVPAAGSFIAVFDGNTRRDIALSPNGSLYSNIFSTYTLADGAHTLVVSAYDSSGTLHSASETVFVGN